MAILVLSAAVAAIMSQAEEAGADHCYPKALAYEADSSLQLLGKQMVNALHNHGFERVPVDTIDLWPKDRSLPLKAIVAWIGEENIKRIALNFVTPSISRIKLRVISGGFSGAAVLAARCFQDETENSPPVNTDLLLKISRDQELIEDECGGLVDTGFFSKGIFPEYLAKEPASSNGWYGIGSALVGGARTLSDWINEPECDSAEVVGTLEKLFQTTGLSKVYGSMRELRNDRPNEHLCRSLLSEWRLASIEMALEELDQLCKDHDPLKSTEEAFDPELIKVFLHTGRFVNVDSTLPPKGSLEVWSHGDLHGRNLIVDRGERLWMVDAANVEPLPWSADISRLIVDICLTCLDPGPDSHEWDSIGRWLTAARNILEGTPVGSEEPVVVVLDWLSGEIKNLVLAAKEAAGDEWQLRLNLAIEFLRASYRQQDTPSPKRVLALLAGCLGLRYAAAAFAEAQE